MLGVKVQIKSVINKLVNIPKYTVNVKKSAISALGVMVQ